MMKNFFEENKISISILIMVASFFLVMQSFSTIADGIIKKRSAVAISTISGSGSAEIFIKPDIAQFFITIREEEKEVEKAQQKMTEKANKALKMLKEKGIDDKDIKTQNYATYPKYFYQPLTCTKAICPPAKQVLSGYEAVETIAVKLHNISAVGEIFSEAAKLSIGEVGGMSFAVEDQDKLKTQARAEAIAKAKEDAKATAKALGVGLGRFINFSENNFPPNPRAMMASPQMAVPQIEAGQQKIVANVTVTYEIR
jgi:uncharacterized protein YggE